MKRKKNRGGGWLLAEGKIICLEAKNYLQVKKIFGGGGCYGKTMMNDKMNIQMRFYN